MMLTRMVSGLSARPSSAGSTSPSRSTPNRVTSKPSRSSGVVAEWSRYTIGINSMARKARLSAESLGGGLASLLPRVTRAGELSHRAAEGLHVFVDVEQLVAADWAFTGRLGQAVRMLGL